MPLRPLRWLAASLVAAGVASCVRAERLDEQIARAWCDHAVECGQYPNVSKCMEIEYVEPPASYLDAAIEAGRIDYHGARAHRCVRAIKKLRCHRGEDTSEIAEACEGIFEGAVEPEEPCMLNDECVGERSLCGFDPRLTEPCSPGACRFRPRPFAAGEPCQRSAECERGTVCDSVCVALPEAGEPCFQGYLCAEDASCDPESVTCVGPPGVGEACGYGRECAPELFCDSDQRCAKRAKKGAPCHGGNESCLRGDTICYAETCQKRGAPGDRCDAFTPPCVPYAHCSNERCVEYAWVGESCGGQIDFTLCYPGLVCGADQTCAKPSAPAVDGEICPIPE